MKKWWAIKRCNACATWPSGLLECALSMSIQRERAAAVAEILGWMVPLMREVGIDARWEVIAGPA